jgi:FKBP-type peptidyl-prolyl cis-trans isomerase
MRGKITKKFLLLFLVVGIGSLGFAEEANQGNEKADLSYAFGMVIGADLEEWGLEFDYSAFAQGLRDYAENRGTWFTIAEAIERVETAIRAAMMERAEINRQEGEYFLAQNAAQPGVYITPSGLQYRIITEGTGRQPEASDFIRVHYTGFLINGTIFDSSLQRGEPEEFPLQGVIPGWSEGLQLMREGGKSLLFIPPQLAYGTQGAGNSIPPNSGIVFEVELLEIMSSEQ